jgi:hypothetical protein
MEEAYKAVSEYVANNSTDFDLLPAEVLKENSDAYQSMINHLDKLQAFQEFVSSGASPAEVAEVAANTFGSPNVNNSLAVDPTILDTFKTLLEWSEPVQVLLNEMPVLTGGIEANKPFQLQGYNKRVSKSINSQTEQKIVAYLQDKNVT